MPFWNIFGQYNNSGELYEEPEDATKARLAKEKADHAALLKRRAARAKRKAAAKRRKSGNTPSEDQAI